MPPSGQSAMPRIVAAGFVTGTLPDMATELDDFLICMALRTNPDVQTPAAGWTDLGSASADPSLLSMSICGRICDGSTYADPYALNVTHGFVQIRGGGFDISMPSSYATITPHVTADNTIEWAASRLDARLTVQIACARLSQTDRGVLVASAATFYPEEFNGDYLDTRIGFFEGPTPGSSKTPAPDSDTITAVLSFT